MENLVIKHAVITSMSNKQREGMTSTNPRKTAYVAVNDPKEAKKLEDFGLTHYTAKTGEKFYIIKMAEKLRVYNPDQKEPMEVSMALDQPSMKTADGVEVELNILKAYSDVNDKNYYRIGDILITSAGDLENIEATNPFA